MMKYDAVFDDCLTWAQRESRIHQQEVRAKVRALCCEMGEPTILLPYYYCFGLEIDRLVGMDLEGQTLALEAAPVLQKWVSRGLRQSVLEAIQTQMFQVEELRP